MHLTVTFAKSSPSEREHFRRCSSPVTLKRWRAQHTAYLLKSIATLALGWQKKHAQEKCNKDIGLAAKYQRSRACTRFHFEVNTDPLLIITVYTSSQNKKSLGTKAATPVPEYCRPLALRKVRRTKTMHQNTQLIKVKACATVVARHMANRGNDK